MVFNLVLPAQYEEGIEMVVVLILMPFILERLDLNLIGKLQTFLIEVRDYDDKFLWKNNVICR